MSVNADTANKTFEELLVMLRETVARLDGVDLTLDEAVVAYEQCVQLATACSVFLDEAELRVSQLNVTASGLAERNVAYTVSASDARRLLLSDEDDELDDLLDEDEL